MPLISAHELFARAEADAQPLAAFNAITLEHAEGVVLGANRAQQPVIIQVSENAISYHGSLEPLAAALVVIAQAAPIPVVLHLDHITRHDDALAASTVGFSSVMFDASRLDYDDNVRHTAALVEAAHDRGLWVESELGEIGGKDSAHAPGAQTRPDDAARYSAATRVDSLAVAVGSSHAMTDKNATLNIELIEQIATAVSVPLVLHGSSGVPHTQLVRACRAGIVKVNIGTALNSAFTGAVRSTLARSECPDPRHYLRDGREALAQVVEEYLTEICRPFRS